ncbi:MAG: glycosyltransferase family 4 protein [Dissulfuribacterales bacterium]
MPVKKVAFIIGSDLWMGGVNYFRNLFEAVRALPDPEIDLVIFTGTKSDCHGLDKYAGVVRTPLLEKNTLSWVVRQVCKKVLGNRDYFLVSLLKRHNISLLSHSSRLWKGCGIATIVWIPDFQHLHLPEFFPRVEIQNRNKSYRFFCRNIDIVLLSSRHAQNDLKDFYNKASRQSRVLPFMSCPGISQDKFSAFDELCEKFRLNRRWFYLPNQFWKHKNHRVVFEAVHELKKQGEDVLLVCTGSIHDYRNPGYYEELMERVRHDGILDSIMVLGDIPYVDVLSLMFHSIAVINPSLFEGWSSTVEEAKSLGKRILLSDIEVHQEQAPERGYFFDPFDFHRLAGLMKTMAVSYDSAEELKCTAHAQAALPERQRKFAEQYQDIVLEACSYY